MLAFLRQVGCPFAEATVRRLDGAARRHTDVQWIAVSQAHHGATRNWCESVGIQESQAVYVVSDPGRSVYATWGVGTTDLRHFAGMHSLRAGLALARRGIRNRHPHGSRWQGAATFAIDGDGIVRLTHFPAHAGDLPDLDAAAFAARRG